MKNVEMVNRIMYFFFLFGFLFYLFSGFIFSKVDIKTPADDKIKMVIEPDKKEYIGDGTVEYKMCIRDSSSTGRSSWRCSSSYRRKVGTE